MGEVFLCMGISLKLWYIIAIYEYNSIFDAYYREKSRYDEREHHPDYYDRRLGRDQLERGLNQPNVINSKSDDTARGGSFAASDNTYYAEDNRRDRSGSGYGSSSDQRNSLSYKNRDRGRDFYRR